MTSEKKFEDYTDEELRALSPEEAAKLMDETLDESLSDIGKLIDEVNEYFIQVKKEKNF